MDGEDRRLGPSDNLMYNQGDSRLEQSLEGCDVLGFERLMIAHPPGNCGDLMRVAVRGGI